MQEYKIYVDLDDTLADFSSKVLEITGKPYSKESWQYLDKIPKFFRTLAPKPNAKKFYSILQQIAKTTVLGALPLPTNELKTSMLDKTIWINQHLPYTNAILVPSHLDKAKYASQYSILIDDSPRNIKHWQEHGGIGILYTNQKDVLKQVINIILD